MGPRMEPCGTLQEGQAGGEEEFLMLTEKLLLLK